MKFAALVAMLAEDLEEQAIASAKAAVGTLRSPDLHLSEADTEVEAATTLGVSRVVLRQVAADAGIDQETVIRQRATRQQTAAWPALLRSSRRPSAS